MGEDLSTGAKIGVVLILLCAIISIVFSIMSIMKNITTQGTEDLQHSLSSMLLQKFDDYDQRTVTGAQVVAACKLFQDQPYAIVVYTNANSGKPSVYGLEGCSYVGVGTNDSDIPVNQDFSGQNSGVYANIYESNSFKLADSKGYVVGKTPDPNSGGYTYNNNRMSMNDRTSGDYVGNAAKFKSYLIKTTSDIIIGVVFDEV